MTKTSDKWWSEWINSDTPKRIDMVKRLPFIDDIRKIGRCKEINLVQFRYITGSMLNSYFEDLEELFNQEKKNGRI